MRRISLCLCDFAALSCVLWRELAVTNCGSLAVCAARDRGRRAARVLATANPSIGGQEHINYDAVNAGDAGTPPKLVFAGPRRRSGLSRSRSSHYQMTAAAVC